MFMVLIKVTNIDPSDFAVNTCKEFVQNQRMGEMDLASFILLLLEHV